MKLTVQGHPYVFEGEGNLKALIEALDEQVPYVTPRVNGVILHRRDFENVSIGEGDRIELLYFMGGGASLAETDGRAAA